MAHAAQSDAVPTPEEDAAQAVVKIPGIPPARIANPDLFVRAAASFVATNEDWSGKDKDGRLKKYEGHHSWRQSDLCNIRFFSFWDYADPAQMKTDRLFLNWWVQQLSFNPHTEPLHEVPGTNGRLLWCNLVDYRWNAAAWQRVSERELFIAEPWIDHDAAEYLRRKLVCPLSAKALKGREIAAGQGAVRRVKILPAGTVVTASQFIRDTLETDRSDSYYDLLFAKWRFTNVSVSGGETNSEEDVEVKKPVTLAPLVPDSPKLYVNRGGYARRLKPGTPFPSGKVYTYDRGEDSYYPFEAPPEKHAEKVEKKRVATRTLPQGQISYKFVNFPKNEADWERAFGLDRTKDQMREAELDLDFGAIVEGGQDDPKGSIVGLRTRLVVTLGGPYGAGMETYDVRKNTGVKDFAESLIFAGRKFKIGSGAQAERDAGELLAYLPNGGQAGLLIDAKGNRLEVAVNDIAEDSASTTRDRRVRNVGSCVVCHAPDGGYIPTNCIIQEGFKKGIKIKFLDREQENRTKGFFRDRTAQIKGYQAPYIELIETMTRDPELVAAGKPAKGWTGALLAKNLEAFRRRYDGPLDLKTVAAYVGCPEEVLKGLLAKMPFNRAQQLLRGRSVPRLVFEADLYANLQILRQAEVNEANAKRKGGK